MENFVKVDELVASLPGVERTPMVEIDVRAAYDRECEVIEFYKKKAVKPETKFTLFHKAGNQFIADFCVNDLSKPVKEVYNWHLQNTSQWLYVGRILVQDGKVSTHLCFVNP